MEREPRPHPEVVCLVFFRDGEFLLEQRLEDDNFKGRWTFTGGKVEKSDYIPGKDYLEVAAAREALEEVNLRPTAMEVFTSFGSISMKNYGHYLFHGVWVKEWRGAVKNKEGKQKRKLRWIPLDKVAKFIGDTEVDKRVLESFLLFLKP